MNPAPASERSLSRNLLGLILVIVLAALIVGVGLFVIVQKSARGSGTLTLPDGTRIKVLGAVMLNQSFTTDKPWIRVARKLLPSRFLSMLPPSYTETTRYNRAYTNRLGVYLQVITPAAGAWTGLVAWNKYQAEDNDGFLYSANGSFSGAGSLPRGYICSLILPDYPRREKSFLLHLYDSRGATIGTLRIPNPVRGPFPEWQPSPMPQTITNGPVTLTLKGVKRDVTESDSLLKPDLRLEIIGPGLSSATIRSTWFLDAYGNQTQRLLSPRETAWKVRSLVHLDKTGDFALADKLVLTNLPVPTANTFTALGQVSNIAGLNIKILAIADVGGLYLSNGVPLRHLPVGQTRGTHWSAVDEEWDSNQPFLVITASNAYPELELQFRVHDDQGRNLNVTSTYIYERSSGVYNYQPSFKPAADAKSLTLEVIVNRPLVFDFLINPADVQPAKP